MNAAANIRRVAIEEAPNYPIGLRTLMGKPWYEVFNRLPEGTISWYEMSETEKRMFLLFVAEDLS